MLVAGSKAEGAARAGRHRGIEQVLHVDDAGLADQLAEAVAVQVLAVAADYGHIVFAATSHGKNVAPRVAAALDVAQVSDVTKVLAPDTFERPIYAGNAIATVQSRTRSRCLPCAPPALIPSGHGGAATIKMVAAVAVPPGSTFVGRDRQERPA